MNRRNADLYNVVENDRMYRKQRIVAAKVLLEEAKWIQSMRYMGQTDPYLQFAVEKAITERWGDNV